MRSALIQWYRQCLRASYGNICTRGPQNRPCKRPDSYHCYFWRYRVGKSYVLRQCLEKWQIPYRLIPVYIDTSQLQESIDFEASLAQGKMVMASGLLGDTSNRCWVVDDAHVLSPEVRHALLVEAKRRQILLILTINHEDRTLDDVEWELVDVHVSMDVPTLQSKVKVLQRRRDEI